MIEEELEMLLEQESAPPIYAPETFEELEAAALDPRSLYHVEARSALQAMDPQQHGIPGYPSPKDQLGPPHNYSAGYERDFQIQVDNENRAKAAAEAARQEQWLKSDEEARQRGPSQDQINYQNWRNQGRRD